MEPKSIIQSKTFWFNLVTGLVAIATMFDPSLLSAFGLNETHQMAAMKIIGTLVAIGNILLRFLSGSPIAIPGKKTTNTLMLLGAMYIATCATGCSAYNQLKSHCRFTGEYSQDKGGFTTCLQCDSVAKSIQKIINQ